MSLSQRIILIVDDDDLVLDVATSIVEHLGYEVRTATTASKALLLAKESRPDVALIDFVLPDLDGIELTKRLLAMLPTLKVVMTSGRDSSEAELGEKAREAGVQTFVAKPFTVNEIADAIRC